MSKKMMIVDPEKCTGCRNCELVCSVKHNGASSPALARIHIVKWENENPYMPMRCQHCDDAPCVRACLTGALSRDLETGVVTVDEERCIGCGTCMLVCPVGVLQLDKKQKKMLKCDLCQGEEIPACVANCPNEALAYVDEPEAVPEA